MKHLILRSYCTLHLKNVMSNNFSSLPFLEILTEIWELSKLSFSIVNKLHFCKYQVDCDQISMSTFWYQFKNYGRRKVLRFFVFLFLFCCYRVFFVFVFVFCLRPAVLMPSSLVQYSISHIIEYSTVLNNSQVMLSSEDSTVFNYWCVSV